MRNAALIAALFQFIWMCDATAYEPVTCVGSGSVHRVNAITLVQPWVKRSQFGADHSPAQSTQMAEDRRSECAIEVGTFLHEAPLPAALFTAEEQFSVEELDKQAASPATAMANEVVFISGGVEYRR